jgi:hypothetical protein
MEHVVFYQSPQGAPAFRRLASLEDAVSFVEHLRNVEGVTEFSVFSLSPVTLSMRAYYHVEVAGGEPSPPAQAPVSEPVAEAASPFGHVPEAPTDEAPAAPAAAPPPLPDAPPFGAPLEPVSPTSGMSFNAMEEEATAPLANVPFAAAPLPPASPSIPETFVKDEPMDLPAPADAADAAAEPMPIDPSVVDPTTEEVVPAPPTGRRSMGFFARS